MGAMDDLVTVIIDLNIRVRGKLTFACLSDCNGPVQPGQRVRVVEQESGVHGTGVVADVDRVKRLVYLAVPWADLQLPDETGDV